MGRPASRSGAEARALEGAGEVSGAVARPEVKIGLPSHASDACGVGTLQWQLLQERKKKYAAQRAQIL